MISGLFILTLFSFRMKKELNISWSFCRLSECWPLCHFRPRRLGFSLSHIEIYLNIWVFTWQIEKPRLTWLWRKQWRVACLLLLRKDGRPHLSPLGARFHVDLGPHCPIENNWKVLSTGGNNHCEDRNCLYLVQLIRRNREYIINSLSEFSLVKEGHVRFPKRILARYWGKL